MSKGVSKILAAAVACLTLPVASQAASVVLSYTSLAYDADGDFSSGSTTVPIVAGSATIPKGNYIRFNLTAAVAGDSNPASLGTYSTGTHVQPPVLGIGSLGLSLTSSSPNLNATDAGGISTISRNSAFVSGSSGDVNSKTPAVPKGSIGVVSVLRSLIAGGVNAGDLDAASTGSTGTGVPGLILGVTPTDLFTNVFFDPVTIDGTYTITATVPSTSMTFVTNVNPGNAPVTKSTYTNRDFTTGDSLTGPGVLTLRYGAVAVPEPTSLAVLALGGVGLLARRRKA